MKEVVIKTDFIKLDSFLKFCGEVSTGSEAKNLILGGFVKISGKICRQRGRKITPNTEINVNKNNYKVIKE